MASNRGIFDKLELAQAIRFLHDLGSLMHFNNELLRDKLVINPQFMVDLMACLVSINNNCIVDGKLYHRDVEKIWKKYDPSLHPWILKITERFDLTYALQDQNMNLVPCLMPDMPPIDLDSFNYELTSEEYASNSLSKRIKKEIKVIYQFDYLPAGLFNRAQVRMFQLTDNKIIWKHGSLLKKNNHLALILRNSNQIQIKVQGVKPENLVFLIHEVLETLMTESFNGVIYDFLFPCPDCYEQGAIDIGNSMYSSSLVRRATQLKAVFLQCRNYFHVIPLTELHARMPPDTIENYDLQLKHSVRDLKLLKQEMKYDIVIIYSIKDTQDAKILHPRQIKQDLEKEGYKVWFSEVLESVKIDSLTLILRNSELVLYCMSNNFTSDKFCCEIFNYAKTVLNKQHLLVALGESFDWQVTQVGSQVTHELFIKVNTIERYQTSLPDLLAMAKKKLKKTETTSKKFTPQCFLSYCRVNSKDAISKGTPLKNKDSLGWEDPRSLKTFLEKEGYSVWVDYEQVGSKRTLYEDIVDGIRNSQVFISCVSNEYARSENCLKEFRFASNLKIPIIICLFGSPNAKCEWRNTELGILSCLISKEINFQLENPYAFEDLKNEIRSYKIEPIAKQIKSPREKKNSQTDQPVEAQTAYTELFELAQRKFLRQVANFSDNASSKPFPRLIIIELQEEQSFKGFSSSSSNQPSSSITDNSLNNFLSPSNFSPMHNSLSNNSPSRQNISFNRRTYGSNRLCLKALCEHESGWHVCANSLEYEPQLNIPNNHLPYLQRIMTLVKHSEMSLEIIQKNKLDDFLNYIEDKLPNNEVDQNELSVFSSTLSSPMIDPDTVNFKDSYNSLKAYVINKLAQLKFEPNEESGNNINRINLFGLNRCILPSGKVVWLCDEHSQDQHVQVLSKQEYMIISKFQNDEFNYILLEELKNM